MATRFPTRTEIKCTGCSFVIAQILLIGAVVMHSIDYDLYTVTKEEHVIRLHDLLSSTKHRTEIEIAIALTWISLPFLLIGLYGIKKLLRPMYEGTSGEMFLYLAEKSYIMFILVVTIIVPALSLTASAFQWSFAEYSPDINLVSTGYYVQLGILLFNAEIIDCVAIADATFMVSLFLLPRVIMRNDPAKVKRIATIFEADLPKCLRDFKCFMLCHKITVFGFVISLFIIFCIVLFEFGATGFFSPLGRAKYVVIWSFILKIFVGLKFCALGYSKKYDAFIHVLHNDDITEFEVEAIDPHTLHTTGDKTKLAKVTEKLGGGDKLVETALR